MRNVLLIRSKQEDFCFMLFSLGNNEEILFIDSEGFPQKQLATIDDILQAIEREPEAADALCTLLMP